MIREKERPRFNLKTGTSGPHHGLNVMTSEEIVADDAIASLQLFELLSQNAAM